MTKQALIDVAERLFTDPGYSHISLDAIVAGAEVTKGALYHHFSGKQAVFEAVFERVEARATERILDAGTGLKDPWERALAGLRAYLSIVQEPAYRRVVIQDGPSVLGHERFREQEARSTYAVLRGIVAAALGSGTWDLDAATVETFTHLFFGALNSAGNNVALSTDPAREADRVEAVVAFVVGGIQQRVAEGRALGEPTSPR